jgi:2-aminoadipate transaminase
LNVISIATDENGLVLESLEEKLAEFQPKFLYLIPTFQNPMGTTMQQERRERLVQLTKEYDFIVVADEVYHLLNYTSYAQESPKSFAAYIDSENVISLGSFSKILAPGLRLGWLQAHSAKIKRFNTCGLLDSSGGLNPFTSAIIRGVIESGGLDNNLNKLINIYRSRLHVMNSALQEQLPDIEYVVPGGGYFFWLRLPEKIDARVLRKSARFFKVDFRPGTLFSSRGELKNQIRLCFVHYEEGEIREGILRLKECLNKAE